MSRSATREVSALPYRWQRGALWVGLFTAFALLMVFLGLAGVLWYGSRMVLAGN